MLKLRSVSLKLKCSRHPRFSPEDGAAAIKGACSRCSRLLEIFEAHRHLMRLISTTPNRQTEARPAQAQADHRQQRLF